MHKIIPKLSATTIKQQLSPRVFYEEEIDLQSSRGDGWVGGGLCPFHDDSRSGNFRLNLNSGGYRCFACGSKGSDVIAFIQQRDGLSFPETLRYLHDRYGAG